nr:hypothetical protein [Tanacetum cinerariifolium]
MALMIDGTYLKGTYLRTNLLAVGMDANNQIIPLAIGVAQDEPPVDELSRWEAAKVSKRNKKSDNLTVNGVEHLKMCNVKDHKSVHVVDIAKDECSCCKWKLSGLPRGHVCVVSRFLQISNSNRWAKAWFSRRTLKATFQQLVYPLPDVSMWVIPNDLQVVLPPGNEYCTKGQKTKQNQAREWNEREKTRAEGCGLNIEERLMDENLLTTAINSRANHTVKRGSLGVA